MRIKNYRNTFFLKAGEIDHFSEILDQSLADIQTERQNRFRIRLSMEEALLRFRDHFGETTLVTAMLGSWLGKSFIQIDLEGSPYNPLSKEENNLDDWNSSLLTAVGLNPRYSYSGQTNSLKLTLPSKGLNPVLKIIIAIGAGLLCGAAGRAWFDPAFLDSANRLVLDPLYDMWNRILHVLSGPVIFFMVITTILNAAKISVRGGNSRNVFFRYITISIIMACVSIAAGGIVFHLFDESMTFDIHGAGGLLGRLVSLIPNEIFTPFMEANTPQLLVMALVIGNALYLLGSQVEELRHVIRQVNMIGLMLAEWVSRLVPYFVCILIVREIWAERTEFFTGTLWKCLLLSLSLSIVCIVAVMLSLSIKMGVSFRIFFQKIWPPFITALRSGSLNESYGQVEQSCVRKLGINREYTVVSLPHGLVLYMPVSVIGTLIFIINAAIQYDVSVNVFWLGTAAILGVVLFVATPPVPGANLLAYISIFADLSIPMDALIAAMVFDVVFGLFASAANQMMLQMELVKQADRIGLLNRERLRGDVR